MRLKLNIFKDIEKLVLRKVEFVILKSVMKELKRLKDKGGKLSRDTFFILELIQKRECEILTEEESGVHSNNSSVDNVIIRTALAKKGVIATMDESLKRRARRLGIPVISIRLNRLYCSPPDPELWWV